jgi:WD40 repeat protein/class 3 adenylate cyclase/tetratricopeptide (TPR) repeat protein
MADSDDQLAAQRRARVQEFRRRHRTGLLTIVFTDLVGSTQLKQQLGDRDAVALIQWHHALVREILGQFQTGQEIETAGDSFLLVFTTPSDAVTFALLLQSRLRAANKEAAWPVTDRVGIHVGEVFIEEAGGADGGKDLYGIQVDTCARVMSLGASGQVLLTRFAFDNARQVLKGQDLEGIGALSWLNHGAYVLKGVEEPIEICEVREADIEARPPPTTSEKAHRHAAPGSDQVLGWRPALEQLVPGTKWVLQEKLGEGGFGEVWLGFHEALREHRVFKFCFQADRARSLKREVTLFRLLKERVGHHPNIVGVQEVFFDEPPYYIMMDYAEGQDLKAWCQAQGGVEKIPLSTRLEIVAQAGDALQAAHEAGVIHRDVKPANILIGRSAESRTELRTATRAAAAAAAADQPAPPAVAPSSVLVKLTDFGIGQVVSEEYLSGVTRAGFTQTILSDSYSSQTGTQMYMAPELLAGKNASPRSDLYSLGVVLYQLLVADLRRPLATDWAREISDPLLKEDLARCFAGNPQDRFAAVSQLAENLRFLDQRRAALAEQQAAAAARERAAYRRGMWRTAGIAALILAGVLWLALYALNQSRLARSESARAVQQTTRAEASAAESQQRRVRLNVGYGSRLLEDGDWLGSLPWFAEALRLEQGDRAREEVHRRRLAAVMLQSPRLEHVWFHTGGVNQVVFSPDGRRVAAGGNDSFARIWDVESGAASVPPLAHNGPVQVVAFSPDNRWLATGGDDFHARVWDAATGQPVTPPLEHNGALADLLFSPDGRRLLTGASEFMVRLWDIAAGQLAVPAFVHSNFVVGAAFSPEGTRVVTATLDGHVQFWDAGSGARANLSWAAGGRLSGLSLSQDGRWLATGGDDGARVWNATNGVPVTPIIGPEESVSRLTFSPDGRWLAIAGAEHTVRVWDARTGEARSPLLHHGSYVTHLGFSPDGRWLATAASDGRARVWDVSSGTYAKPPLYHSGYFVVRARFSPDGARLVTAARDGSARLWDLVAGTGGTPPLGNEDLRNDALFSPDGSFLAAVRSNTVQVWNASATQAPPAVLRLTNPGSFATVRHAARLLGPRGLYSLILGDRSRAPTLLSFSANGRRLAAADTGQRTVQVWDLGSGQPAGPPITCTNRLGGAALDFSGERVVTVGGTFAQVWEVARGKAVSAALEHEADVNGAGFSRDGRLLCTSGAHSAITWQIASGQRQAETVAHEGPLSWTEFDAAGRRLLTASTDMSLDAREAMVCDALTGQSLGPPMRHEDGVQHAAFSPDGRRVVTASEDMTARVWDATTSAPLTPALRHRHFVLHAAFSADGRWVATGSRDKTARVWDTATGEPVTPPLAHAAAVHHVQFTPTGRQLITLSSADDQLGAGHWQLQVWDLPVTDQPAPDTIRQAQLLASRHLDAVGGMAPLAPEVVASEWPRMRPKEGSDPTARAVRLTAWHRAGAQSAANAREWAAAAVHLDHLIKARPGQWQLHRDRGEAHAQLGAWSKAAADLGSAASLEPDDLFAAWFRLALAQLAAGDAAGYRETCARLFAQFGQTADPERGLSMAWVTCGLTNGLPNPEGPLRLAQQALEREPANARRNAVVGAVLLRAGRVAEAAARFDAGIQANPDDPSGVISACLALCHQRLGHPDVAQRWLDRAAKVVDSDTEPARSSTARGSWVHRLERRLLVEEARAPQPPRQP